MSGWVGVESEVNAKLELELSLAISSKVISLRKRWNLVFRFLRLSLDGDLLAITHWVILYLCRALVYFLPVSQG